MIKKIFALCLTLILIFQGAAFAKDKKKSAEIPLEDRLKISVEVTDNTSFHELPTDKFLSGAIVEELNAKNTFNILEFEGVENFSAIKTLGEKQSASDVGEILIFNPATNDDENFHKETDADYLIYCKIIGIGTTRKNFDSLGIEPGFGIGIGSGRHSHFGFGIFTSIGANFKRTAYCTAVNVKFVKVDTNVVLWQKNFIGQAFRHKKPRKGYDDATDEAYLESIKSAAENISESVTNYTKKFLLKKDKK